MVSRYKNKYRTDSYRCPEWNYSGNSVYFITICIREHEKHFGYIENCKMTLSETGKIANEFWLAIPEYYPFTRIYEHVIMPDHLHGIIEIYETHETITKKNSHKNYFGPQKYNLAAVIRGYKAGVTKKVKEFNKSFAWQSRYYDKIIQDESSFRATSEYIRKNPTRYSR